MLGIRCYRDWDDTLAKLFMMALFCWALASRVAKGRFLMSAPEANKRTADKDEERAKAPGQRCQKANEGDARARTRKPAATRSGGSRMRRQGIGGGL
jgi:hypothetical protein